MPSINTLHQIKCKSSSLKKQTGMLSFSRIKNWQEVHKTFIKTRVAWADPEGGRGVRPLLKNHKIKGFIREIAASLNDFSNRWCKRENVEPDALKEWKINIFKIIDTRISFYSRNTHLLPPKPKSSFRHLKRGFQDFHMNYVLVPADKAANNVVVV